MPRKSTSSKKPIEQYDHRKDDRLNNPPVGLVTPETDREAGKKGYAYDPHLDPALVWAGKAEHTSFEVPTVSLHVHERIDPRTIIEAVRKRNGQPSQQMSLFQTARENPPLREAIEFYKHKHNWSNRLIAGDSLLVMNSLIEKEGLAGQVQMIYIDPPYGIKYGSNFQPFVNKRDVKDGKDEDLTAEPEQIRAFRDTWELGIHSYLTYLRDRLLLARELLTESGSVFVQIGIENQHLVRSILDEVFGRENCVSVITFQKTGFKPTNTIQNIADYILWYAKDSGLTKVQKLFLPKTLGTLNNPSERYDQVELPDGTRRALSKQEKQDPRILPQGSRVYQLVDVTSQGANAKNERYTFQGRVHICPPNRSWDVEKIRRIEECGRLVSSGKRLMFVKYLDEFPVFELTNVWDDCAITPEMVYVVQTNPNVIQRCLVMTTDPGDLVFDPTCGSGTTAFVAEQWGRRWITCDTSRVAITLTKQRLMTALYHYYELAHPDEGVGSGFRYRTVPHITLKSIANNPEIREGMSRKQIDDAIARYAVPETLYDQPFVDNKRARVSGPFTVEAVPAPVVKSLEAAALACTPPDGNGVIPADESVARSGETLRQAEWRDELLRCGIRGRNNQYILFSRVEPLPGTRWLHADAEATPNDLGSSSVREERGIYGRPAHEPNQRVVISFGPEHAPLEQKQVELAWEEARKLVPRPGMIIFAAFQFDPEAAKDIDETDPEKAGMTFLKVQMNADLLTDDLKKKRASNESFWLIGQPDLRLEKIKAGGDKGKYLVHVLGFDYYNTKTGTIESGGTERIAMWMLDPDYDGRSLFPRQVFFPMAGEKDGWSRLAKNLKAEIDEQLIEAYKGTVSLPFEPGGHKRIAVKIIDDRGIESLKIVEAER